MSQHSVWIGWDPREAPAFAVARHSVRRHLFPDPNIPVEALVLDDLKDRGLYTRPTEQRGNQTWDLISDAPVSTEFSNSRFLVPYLARNRSRWALFMDCDVLVRANLSQLFRLTDNRFAAMVVKHDHRPTSDTKMDGQAQTNYSRKNWSSICMWNVEHPSNRKLTPDLVSSVPGRDLHRFCWLADDEIGELPPRWNWLAGHSDPKIDPAIVHHTSGSPYLPGFQDAPFAQEWRDELARWARQE